MSAKHYLWVALLLVFGGSALADEDHDTARRLREQGRIVPLEQIVKTVKEQQEGTLLEVELEQSANGRYVYEVELLDAKGRVRKLLFDAETGQPIDKAQFRKKGKESEHH